MQEIFINNDLLTNVPDKIGFKKIAVQSALRSF